MPHPSHATIPSTYLRQFIAVFALATTLLAQTTANVPCARDNTLYESATGSLSAGAGTGLFAGRTGQISASRRRAVMRFDVAAQIPAGSRILTAVLTVNITRGSSISVINVTGHRVLRDWGEGTSIATGGLGGGGAGGPATTNDATWIHTFFPGNPWNTPGGDFVANASFTIATQSSGLVSSTPGTTMLSDVQAWIDNPTQNFGWLLKGDETAPSTARRIDSRESTLGTPPVLTITYVAPGQSAPWGQGCPVNGQPFSHSWVGAPIGGTTAQLTQTNGPASALAANLISLDYNPTGFPLLPQCRIYLPFPGQIVTHSLIVLNAVGNGSTPINLPTGFPGILFATQAAALSNTPAGYVLSNATIALLQ